MKKILLPILFSTGLAGCQTIYHKDGGTQGEFAQDKYACMQDSASAYQENLATAQGRKYQVTYDANAGNRNSMFASCMNARGWYATRK
jgi:uncharacterized protein YceK